MFVTSFTTGMAFVVSTFNPLMPIAGLGILAALCCHICARKSKLGRHCDNYCVPAKPGDEDCAVGAFADPA